MNTKFSIFQRKKSIITVSVVLILLLLPAFDYRLKVQHYSITSDKIDGTIRIALITDLHSCAYGTDQSRLIDAIDAESPDLLLLGGDICDDVLPNDNAESLLKGISGRYPCYYVTGNHEYWSKDIDTILNLFQSYNVTILNGTHDTVEINDQFINICGITDPAVTKYTDSDYGIHDQLKALKNVSKNSYYTILLAHRPELIAAYSNYDFDLVLSGHAHGGQWRIPGIINGLYAPNQGLFPKYAGGKYNIGDSTMIVSRGLAKESTRIPRIFNRPELVMVDINGSNKKQYKRSFRGAEL